MRLLEKHRGPTPQERRAQLKAAAEGRVAGDKKAEQGLKKTRFMVAGVREVTQLIQKGRAQLVVIAHDVEPLTLVLYLPALCRKHDVPYCIIKSKARLGAAVRRKTVTALALANVNA